MEWAAAPGEAPTARYQHAVSFVGTRLHVSGGALGGGSMVDDALSLATLNTSAGPAAGWSVADPPRGASAAAAEAAAASASRRCRHTTAGVGPLVFTCGGLRGGTLLGDMFVAEESPEEGGMTREEATARLAEVIDLAAPAWRRWLRDAGLEEEANRAIREADAASDVAGPEPLGSRAPDGKKKTTAAAPKGAAGGAFGTPQGGSFNAALLRMQGTVLGAMFSFALVTLIRGDLASGAGAARLILLAAFTFFTTYSRLNAEYAYAGVVAAFTAYVVALGIPSGADLAEARGYAHRRVEQNLLGLVVLVFVELGVFPTFAHDATRLAAGETVASARVAAETVYDATVGTDCVRCRERAARDAGRTLEDVAAKLDAQKVLLVQAAAEPHLWSKPFPLEAHQRMATELEHVARVLGLMRMALGAMAAEASRGMPLRHAAAETDGDSNEREGGEATGGEFLNLELDAGRRLRLNNPRAQVAALLAPTEGYVAALGRAVKARLAGAAADLSRGEARWATREASASSAKAQADLGAFVTHTRGRGGSARARRIIFAEPPDGAVARVRALHQGARVRRGEPRRRELGRAPGGRGPVEGRGGGRGAGERTRAEEEEKTRSTTTLRGVRVEGGGRRRRRRGEEGRG